MLFNSLQFIFVFIPLILFGYFLISRLTSNSTYNILFLAIASLIFYGYWDLKFIPVISISILLNYIFGIFINNKNLKFRKLIFISAVALNLSVIFFYKYLNFGIEIFNMASSHKMEAMKIILPLGISFFTFTQIAYLADVLYGHPGERNFFKYFLFVTYFPHLIAGPILHHKEMMPQFNTKNKNLFSTENLAIGLTVFSIGLFKKVIIADGFSLIANPIFTAITKQEITSLDAMIGALSYTLQIYFDFSGYSDMAVGLSFMFGIKLPFNFDAPYKSQSMIEFWQRWHITLSRFLRDYLYIALGGNRKGALRRYVNLILTMLLGGLWHGAGWTFVAWGFLHGMYLSINHWWRGLVNSNKVISKFSNNFLYKLSSLILTQFCVVIAWVYFRADSLHHANNMVKTIFGIKQGNNLINSSVQIWIIAFILLSYAICILLPNLNSIFDKCEIGLKTYQTKTPWNAVVIKWNMTLSWVIITSLLLIFSLLFILIVGDGTEFLYFRF
ncbi:MAG TPA: MBOAT family O-acyltransferase [Gammaproteobacteria bacterium]|jgi:hypothetical protein|nr:MBOAT family O-acyltransferase [Gammaproteobacteria bacterium]